MKTFAEAEARLAERLPGYESRPQQKRLAEAVEAAFANPQNTAWMPTEEQVEQGAAPIVREHLFAQAGCGTGKSLGYSIPAILAAVASNKRVIVSVTTKALQDQLSEKDYPFLETNLGVDFTWTVLKGRSNYLCPNRAESADLQDVPLLPQIIKRANEATFSGLREDLGFDVPPSQWSKVCAEADDCRDNNCRPSTPGEGTKCFAEAARAFAKECDVVIVNHALFFTDLMVKHLTGAGGMLNEYDFVIFDEAHEVEEIAGNTLGYQFTEGTFRALTAEVRTWADRYADDGIDAVGNEVAALMTASTSFFEALPVERLRNTHLNELVDQFGAVYTSLFALRTALGDAKVENTGEYRKAMKRKTSLLRRTNNAVERFGALITDSFDDSVRWVEKERTRMGEEVKVVKSAPINVAPFLSEVLFSKTPCILTSATLASKGSFDFIAGRLGVEHFSGLDVGTPFDFPSQARLYVPVHLPEPVRDKTAAWETGVRQEIMDLVRKSEGRALILFTSVKHMKETYEAVAKHMPYNVLMQGQAAPRVLAAQFAEDTHSVLFGTKSFFTGVDFQGETCSLVAVCKMPFPVPSEPLVEARCEAIERNGGNAFSDYTVPVMSLVLQQAAGRLIRHRNDTGVVAILDPRIISKGYGKQVVRDLPPMPIVKTIEEVGAFFEETAKVPA